MSEISSSNEPTNNTQTPEVSSKTSAKDQKPHRHQPKKHAKSGGAWQILFLLVIVGGLGAGGYFLWLEFISTTQQLTSDTESTHQRLDVLDHQTENLEQQINSSLTEDIKTLQSQQRSLEMSIANLRSELTGDARVWDVEEIATLLQIANDRLHLEKEVAPSLAALEAADRHIQALKNPALLEVRRRLAEEIAALRATADPDVDGMALSLGAMIQGIDRLPISNASLQEANVSATTSEKGWRGVLNDLWTKLKSLVSIQHRGKSDRPLLAPDERYFLRQNLRLNMEAARIALLRRDSQTFRQTLRDTQEWITLYFDNDAPATTAALQELAHLQQTDIAPDLPDISGSLDALQSWLKGQNSPKPNHDSGATQP